MPSASPPYFLGKITLHHLYPPTLALVSGAQALRQFSATFARGCPTRNAKISTVRITNTTTHATNLPCMEATTFIMIPALTLVGPVLVRRRRKSEGPPLCSVVCSVRHLPTGCKICVEDCQWQHQFSQWSGARV